MKKSVLPFAAIVLAGLAATPASAQTAQRAWVSIGGTDSATCGPATSPCRTFQKAHDQLASGGEIAVLNAGGYGPLTITKSVSVVNDGVGLAGMAVGTGNAITINAGANDTVLLRGISVEGTNLGDNGIVFNSGKSLSVINCTVRHFKGVLGNETKGNGILIAPTGTATPVVEVHNSILSDNGAAGLTYRPSSGTPVGSVLVDHSTLSGNRTMGVWVKTSIAGGATALTVTNSNLSHNSVAGIGAISLSNPIQAISRNNVLDGNFWGIDADGSAISVAFEGSTISNSNAGIANNTAPNGVASYGNNLFFHNLADVSGDLPLTGAMF